MTAFSDTRNFQVLIEPWRILSDTGKLQFYYLTDYLLNIMIIREFTVTNKAEYIPLSLFYSVR